ncbi:hypothetical protein BaRGS_00029194 [Batillaria attramentaria]|uniref:Uncharacterized protein n=1 Tax=Batillaria attramentaria TaxID=370345 RepID=A0ABD0JWT8_9CAEN
MCQPQCGTVKWPVGVLHTKQVCQTQLCKVDSAKSCHEQIVRTLDNERRRTLDVAMKTHGLFLRTQDLAIYRSDAPEHLGPLQVRKKSWLGVR